MLLVGEKQYNQLKGDNKMSRGIKTYEEHLEADKYRDRINTAIDRQIDVMMQQIANDNDTWTQSAEKWKLMMKELYSNILYHLEDNEQEIIQEVLAQID